jgi:hypothetical protein
MPSREANVHRVSSVSLVNIASRAATHVRLVLHLLTWPVPATNRPLQRCHAPTADRRAMTNAPHATIAHSATTSRVASILVETTTAPASGLLRTCRRSCGDP